MPAHSELEEVEAFVRRALSHFKKLPSDDDIRSAARKIMEIQSGWHAALAKAAARAGSEG